MTEPEQPSGDSGKFDLEAVKALEAEVARLRGEVASFEQAWRTEQELRIKTEDELEKRDGWLNWWVRSAESDGCCGVEFAWLGTEHYQGVRMAREALAGEEPPGVDGDYGDPPETCTEHEWRSEGNRYDPCAKCGVPAPEPGVGR